MVLHVITLIVCYRVPSLYGWVSKRRFGTPRTGAPQSVMSALGKPGQGVEDIADLGAGRVIRLHVHETHPAVRVDDQHGRHWQFSRRLRVDRSQIESQPTLGVEDLLGLLECNTDPTRP